MIFAWIFAGVYLFVVTWVFYLAVMNLSRNKDRITPAAKFIAYPVALVGVIIDAIFNITVGTVLFLDLPREWLFTHRLERVIADFSGIRKKIAMWLCINLLDPFDPAGEHCKKKSAAR